MANREGLAGGTTAITSLGFDFFFIPPLHQLATGDMKSAITLFVMVAVALTISGLGERTRREQASARCLGERRIHTRVPTEIPMVPMDSMLVEQVLVNLLENSLRYSPEGTPIDIGVSAATVQVAVELADRGQGRERLRHEAVRRR